MADGRRGWSGRGVRCVSGVASCDVRGGGGADACAARRASLGAARDAPPPVVDSQVRTPPCPQPPKPPLSLRPVLPPSRSPPVPLSLRPALPPSRSPSLPLSLSPSPSHLSPLSLLCCPRSQLSLCLAQKRAPLQQHPDPQGPAGTHLPRPSPPALAPPAHRSPRCPCATLEPGERGAGGDPGAAPGRARDRRERARQGEEG
eukprot:1672036-Rhodomonas_salina.1